MESSDEEIDQNELEDIKSETEDAILKENAAKEAGRIIKDEQDEIIKVSLDSYKNYFKFAGGWPIIIFLNFLFLLLITMQAASNYFMQKWAFADEETQNDKFNYYVIVIYSATLLTACSTLARTNTQIFAGLKVGKRLHNELMKYVFNAPINLFFDVTPIGKILNRFSKDLAVIDEQIYYNFGGFLVCLWQSIACLVIASIAIPLILVIIFVFTIIALCLFLYAMRAYKDCYRIESVTMSPILSYF